MLIFRVSRNINAQAVKERKKVLLQVLLPDGRNISMPGDPAITASEICESLASSLGITDPFGFSIYVAIFSKVTLLFLILFFFNLKNLPFLYRDNWATDK